MGEVSFTPGQYVVRRHFSRWSLASFEVGKLVKLTEKQAVVHIYRDQRVPLGEIIAAFPTEEAAQQLAQDLHGALGTYRQKRDAANAEARARTAAAAAAVEKVFESLIAKARGEPA